MNFNTIKEMIIPEGTVSEIRDSLNNLIWRKSLLPSAYQQVEYIETTGTQHIDTGVPLKSGLKMIVDWIYKDADSGNNYTGGHIGSPGNRWLIGSQRNINYFFAIGPSNVQTEFAYGNRDVLEAYWANKASYIKVNGVLSTKYSYQNYTISDEPDYTFYLGATDRNGTASLKPKLTIYSCQFYQDDVLVRDYIPCYRKSDGEIGLYDIVNKVFYTNAGSGTFKKGEDVENTSSPYQKVEYIESTGTQYIDTGLEGIDGYTFECDMSFTEWYSTYNYVSGAADGSTNRIYFTRYDRDGSQKFRYTYNNSSPDDFEAPELNERFTLKAIMEKGKQEQYINGVLKTSSAITTEVNTSQNIFLFCASYGSEVGNRTGNTSARIYRAKYYLNGELVRDLVPCYRKSDGEIGMYDTLTNVFYGNLGEDTFKKGNDI